jgi:branched-subunit amino acid transport protein
LKIYLLIIGMALVTYIPRMLPMVLPERIQFPGWLDRWLQQVSYAALGALIFPGILISVDGQRPWLGLLGGVTAGLLAFAGLNILIVLTGAIAVVAFVLSII